MDTLCTEQSIKILNKSTVLSLGQRHDYRKIEKFQRKVYYLWHSTGRTHFFCSEHVPRAFTENTYQTRHTHESIHINLYDNYVLCVSSTAFSYNII